MLPISTLSHKLHFITLTQTSSCTSLIPRSSTGSQCIRNHTLLKKSSNSGSRSTWTKHRNWLGGLSMHDLVALKAESQYKKLSMNSTNSLITPMKSTRPYSGTRSTPPSLRSESNTWLVNSLPRSTGPKREWSRK